METQQKADNNIIEFGRLPMQKFKQQGKPSRFNNYIVNAPQHHKPKAPLFRPPPAHSPATSLTHPSADQENLLDGTALNELNSKLSIRSSKERAGNGRINRREVINRQMTKTTIRRMRRYNTELNDPAHEQRLAKLKRRVNDLNATCNQLKRSEALPAGTRTESYAREERRKFMMGQLCFTEIDEERIEQQKKYLNNFVHLSRSLPKMIKTDGNPPQGNKQAQTHLLECLRAIDRIFLVLKQMEFAGFASRSNRFVIDYCTEGRMWLKRVFLSEAADRGDAFTMTFKYSVTPSAEAAKNNFTDFLASAGNNDTLQGYLHDIQALYQHLQSSLTEKRLSKLMNAGWALQGQGGALGQRMRTVVLSRNEAPILRLTTDLEEIQSSLGPMREITKMSRRKFDQLTRSYSRLQALI